MHQPEAIFLIASRRFRPFYHHAAPRFQSPGGNSFERAWRDRQRVIADAGATRRCCSPGAGGGSLFSCQLAKLCYFDFVRQYPRGDRLAPHFHLVAQ